MIKGYVLDILTYKRILRMSITRELDSNGAIEVLETALRKYSGVTAS